MSSKFKVGDRVQFSDHFVSGIGIIVGEPPKWEDEYFAWTLRAESFDHEARGFYKNVEDYEFPARYFAEKDLKPIVPSYQSPVKERVVKEIVPGGYGRVAVETTYLLSDDRLTIYLADSAGEYKQYDAGMLMSAKDLRHAARVFNDLADALQDNNP